jgi:hypothetical protein
MFSGCWLLNNTRRGLRAFADADVGAMGNSAAGYSDAPYVAQPSMKNASAANQWVSDPVSRPAPPRAKWIAATHAPFVRQTESSAVNETHGARGSADLGAVARHDLHLEGSSASA